MYNNAHENTVPVKMDKDKKQKYETACDFVWGYSETINSGMLTTVDLDVRNC